jgi:hypothetical protein
VAIACRAIQNGFDALFVTAAELIDDLSAAFREGRLADALALYPRPGVLIVDEVGCLTCGTDAANMLFYVVNDRHRRRRSMIFTTKKALTERGPVLHADDLARAITDRVLERGRQLTLDGPSIRSRHLGLEDSLSSEGSAEAARIPGTRRCRASTTGRPCRWSADKGDSDEDPYSAVALPWRPGGVIVAREG